MAPPQPPPAPPKSKSLASLGMVWNHARRYPAQLTGGGNRAPDRRRGDPAVPYAFKLIIDRGFGAQRVRPAT